MGNMFEELIALFVVCMILAFAVGGFAMWAMPKVWHWLMPIIHAATA